MNNHAAHMILMPDCSFGYNERGYVLWKSGPVWNSFLDGYRRAVAEHRSAP
jgi:hypothetical protein